MTMRCVLGLLVAGAIVTSASAQQADVRRVELNGQIFTLPAGFEIELVAGPPLVQRPIAADFDEEGRLYVTDSSGANDRVDVQLKTRPHRVVRLEDRDGDGRFEHATVFADKLMFPAGAMWRAGSLYVAAPPSIWKLTDTDGAGMADRREEWFLGKTLTGCANDLHGPYAGPDGWIYWCKGAFARQEYERGTRPPFVTRAAHIFRCRPDGSGLEPVMTGGMDNPVDVVFTPGGERIFTTTFFQHPGGGQRDGLVHAVYGGVYGKDHNVIYDHPWTAPTVMPVLTHLGPAAPSGLVRYEGRAFGPDFQDNLFAALFNLQKVTRHILEPAGATFKTRDIDFLVSSSKDFHPTDVIEDADGSLLVINTGGWYKLCCPTSQLVKPDVLGAIYRVRRLGAKGTTDPRGRALAWEKQTPVELRKLLGDERPTVRKRAIATLAARGQDAVDAIDATLRDGVPEARRNAVWTATRIDHPRARATVRRALADQDEAVRQVALHSVALWRDRDALEPVRVQLRSSSLHNQRAAAEALGRLGNARAVADLLDAAASAPDRVLQHSITYALIEIGAARETTAGLTSPSAGTRRAALVALDQLAGDNLEVATILPWLDTDDANLRETAWWIAGRHPAWGEALAGFLRSGFDAPKQDEAARARLVQLAARLARTPAIQKLLADRSGNAEASAEIRGLALRAMASARLKDTPPAWLDAVTQAVEAENDDLAHAAVEALRSFQLPKSPPARLSSALRAVGQSAQRPTGLRLAALAAIPGGLAELDPQLFGFLEKQLAATQPVAARAAAAEILSRAQLPKGQLLLLAQALTTTGPLEVPRLLGAFARSNDEEVGLALLGALETPAVRAGLRADAVRSRLAKYPAAVQARVEKLCDAIEVGAVQQRARLEELVGKLGTGDVRRGQLVFNNPKAACVSCHAIGYLGGTTGPDLTRIGTIRTERDLLESIVFPSASFVRGYEPITLTTRGGQVLNGLVKRESADDIVVATGANQENRVLRAEIEEMQPSRVSIMPAGLDQQLTPAELADLVAFLKACR